MALHTPADGSAPGYFGVYPAIVTELVDPDRLGRVEVRFPWLGEDGDRTCGPGRRSARPTRTTDQGLQLLPEVDSQVVVAFEAGNLRRPYVSARPGTGGRRCRTPPERSNDVRLLRSRADSRLEFDDAAGSATVRLTMASGHQVILDDAAQEVTVKHAMGCVVKLTATAVEIQANVSLDVSAPMVKVDAPISTFSGMVKVGTLIAEQMVMSPAYTPGAGNIW